MKTLIRIQIILIALSCASPKTQNSLEFTESDLPDPIILSGEKFNIPNITNPIGVVLSKRHAIVWEDKNISDEKFHIIDLTTMKVINSKGVDGLGPGEINMVSSIEIAEEGKIWVYDIESRVYSKYDLLDTNKLAEIQVRSPQTAYFLTKTAWAKNNTLLGSTADGWTKYLHLSLEGDTLGLLGNWYDMINGKKLPRGIKQDELNANAISYLFQGPISGNIEKNIFVKAGIIVDYIDIIDLNKNEIKTVFGPSHEIQDFRIGHNLGYQIPDLSAKSTERYIDAFVGKNSFFVLFFGKTYGELSDMSNLNRLFEMDFDGNILNQYRINYPLNGFSVDEEKRAIYGVTVDREPNLVRFDY